MHLSFKSEGHLNFLAIKQGLVLVVLLDHVLVLFLFFGLKRWDLSSPTQDWTHTPCREVWVLPTDCRGSPTCLFYGEILYFYKKAFCVLLLIISPISLVSWQTTFASLPSHRGDFCRKSVTSFFFKLEPNNSSLVMIIFYKDGRSWDFHAKVFLVYGPWCLMDSLVVADSVKFFWKSGFGLWGFSNIYMLILIWFKLLLNSDWNPLTTVRRSQLFQVFLWSPSYPFSSCGVIFILRGQSRGPCNYTLGSKPSPAT